MGYEVIYHFKEEIEKGEYTEEVSTKTVKVGSVYDEISLEALAAKIMAQLARRNILITDVEIYEFTKKKISYREGDDGILIKGRKFKFDDGPIISSKEGSSGEESMDVESILSDPKMLAALQSLMNGQGNGRPQHPHEVQKNIPSVATNGNNGLKRGKRIEVFDPTLEGEHQVKNSGMKFTQGRQYSILEEKSIGVPPLTRRIYTIADDRGKEVSISAEHFSLPTSGKLQFEDEMQETGPAPGIDLWNSGIIEADMPSLR